jgi:hypothetical protein
MTRSPPGLDWSTARSSPRPSANPIGFLEASGPAVARNPLGASEGDEVTPADMGLAGSRSSR